MSDIDEGVRKLEERNKRKAEKESKMEKIYELVAEITAERIEREKAVKLSRTTLKMIALVEKLYKTMTAIP